MMRIVRDEEELLAAREMEEKQLDQARFQETLNDYRQKMASFQGSDPVEQLGRQTYTQLVEVMEDMLATVEKDLERLRQPQPF